MSETFLCIDGETAVYKRMAGATRNERGEYVIASTIVITWDDEFAAAWARTHPTPATTENKTPVKPEQGDAREAV